jgi:hypothetical protein
MRKIFKGLAWLWGRLWYVPKVIVFWLKRVHKGWLATFAVLGTVGCIGFFYEQHYATYATVSVTGSDPNDAMAYPFALTNNSHVFTLSEISWRCYIVKMISKNGGTDIENTDLNRGSANEVRPGSSTNFSCFGKKALTPMWIEGPFAVGEILISVYYRTAIGKRSVENVKFTWEGETSNPQWIRGDYADDHPAPAKR